MKKNYPITISTYTYHMYHLYHNTPQQNTYTNKNKSLDIT